MQKYSGKNNILDDYIDYLDNYLKQQEQQGKYEIKDSIDWNVMRYHIAQHEFLCYLLRTRFPESMWETGKSRYKIETGMSGSQPWTEYGIAHSRYLKNNMVYQIFWRLDKRGNVPVLLLRFYDKYDKNDPVWSDCHRSAYQCFRKKAEELLNHHSEIDLKWDYVKGYDTGNCFEATLLTIPLEDYLCNWVEKGELLRRQVIALTEYFIDADRILTAN